MVAAVGGRSGGAGGGGLSFVAYFSLSSALAAAVVSYAFQTRMQFYPAVIYLVTSKPAVLVLGNMALAATLMWGRVFKAVFLGPLRDVEVEILYDNARYAITETCLALTIFREELTTRVLTLFTALLFSKSFHWLCQSRVEYVESDTVSRWTHARLVTLMLLLVVVDVAFVAMCVYLWDGPSVLILFGFEYTILAVSVLATLVRYLLHLVDMGIEGNWPQKGSYLFFLEFATEVVRFLAYVAFFAIIFTYYGMPLHIVRDLWMSYVNLKRRLIVFNKYRKLTANMQERFPDASPEELVACEHTCIICRDQMDEGKKLPCGHIFHLDCLRLWLQQQQSCPTCRADIPTADQQQQQATRGGAAAANVPREQPAAQAQQAAQAPAQAPAAQAPQQQPPPQQPPAMAMRGPPPFAGLPAMPPPHQPAAAGAARAAAATGAGAQGAPMLGGAPLPPQTMAPPPFLHPTGHPVPPHFPQPPTVPHQADASSSSAAAAAGAGGATPGNMMPPPFMSPPAMGGMMLPPLMPPMGPAGGAWGGAMPPMMMSMMPSPFPLPFLRGASSSSLDAAAGEWPFSMYRVVAPAFAGGAGVRAGPEASSQLLRVIPRGTVVLIKEQRRAAGEREGEEVVVYAVAGGGFIHEHTDATGARLLEPVPPSVAAPWLMGSGSPWAASWAGAGDDSRSGTGGATTTTTTSSSSSSRAADSPISRALVALRLDMEEVRTEIEANGEALSLLMVKHEADTRRMREAFARMDEAHAGLVARERGQAAAAAATTAATAGAAAAAEEKPTAPASTEAADASTGAGSS